MHLSLLLALTAIVMAGMVAPWSLAGSALLSLLLPVMLCLAGSVTYHTLMANHWNYSVYITIDVGSLMHVVHLACTGLLPFCIPGNARDFMRYLALKAADELSFTLDKVISSQI